MPRKQHGPCRAVTYWVPKRKKPVAYSTKATSDFLAIIHSMHPTATISQLKDILTDKTQWIFNPEAIAVLDEHIKLGYGDGVPDWN